MDLQTGAQTQLQKQTGKSLHWRQDAFIQCAFKKLETTETFKTLSPDAAHGGQVACGVLAPAAFCSIETACVGSDLLSVAVC